MKAGHLTFIGSDIIERLLAGDTPIVDSTYRCLYTATTDGSRVFFHIWAENGHWVWVLHECVFHHHFDHGPDYLYDDDDDDDDPGRSLLGVFPD